jgi:pilus assembly protein Flp/PilA
MRRLRRRLVLFHCQAVIEGRANMHCLGSRGQGLVEYALILALVVLVVVLVLWLLGPSIGNAYSNIVSNL